MLHARSFLSSIILAGIFAAFAWISFAGLLDHQFDTDDHEWLRDTAAFLQDQSAYFSQNRYMPIRPPVDALFTLGYVLWGNNAGYFHATQIGIHILVSLLAVFVFRQLEIDFSICILAGFLFLLNVTHFRAIHWINIYNHNLAACFGLLALHYYYQYLKGQRAIGFSLIALLFMVYSHPSAISIAAFCLYLTYRKVDTVRETLWRAGPFVVAIPLLILTTFAVSPGSPQARGILDTSPDWASILTYLFWYTSRLLTNAHWLWGGISSEPATWELVVGACMILGIVILYVRRVFPLADWAVWCIITVLPFIHRAPEWQFLPFGPSRQLYIATLGSSLVLAIGIFRVAGYVEQKTNPRTAKIVLLAIVLGIAASSISALWHLEASSYYASGRSYIARGDLRTGAELIGRALRHSPEWVPTDAYLRLATASFASGEPQTEIFEAGLKRHPDHPQLRLLRGISLQLSDQPNRVQEGRQDIQTAFQMAQDKANLRSDAGLVFQNLAGYYHENKNYAKAVTYYKEALRYRPNYAIAQFNLANALYKLGRIDEAIETMRQSAENNPNNLNAIQFLGNMLFEQKHFEEAVDVYNHYLQCDPNNPHIYHNLAIALQRQNKLPEAIQAFEHGIAAAPEDLDMREKLAVAQFEAGHLVGAIREYEYILTQAPTDKQALEQITALYIQLKRPQEAARWVQNALALDSTQAYIWYLLAHTQQATDDVQGLQQSLGNALRRDPANSQYREAYLNLGSMFQRRGDVQAARRIYTALATYAPDQPESYINLGILDFARENYAAAVDNFTRATQLLPNDVEARLGLAQALEKNGQTVEAVQAYRQTLASDPDNATARERLAALEK